MELLAPIYAVLFFFVAVLFCDRSNCLNLTNHLHTSALNNASATALTNTSINSSSLVTELNSERHPLTEQPKTTLIPLSVQCLQNTSLEHDKDIPSNSICYSASDAHACFSDPLHCQKHFPSNKRTSDPQNMPKFGEYKFLSYRKLVQVIMEGGVAFLYHPCTDQKEIQKFRDVAHSCLRRFIMTPSDRLHKNSPLALLSYGCFHTAAFVNGTAMKSWLRNRTLYTTLASPVYGMYKKLLVKSSIIVTDALDSIICPTKRELKEYHANMRSTTKKMSHKNIGEQIINERVHAIRHKVSDDNNLSSRDRTKVHPGNATWAASSLFFICGILIGWLIYTKFYAKKKDGEKEENETRRFDYSHVYDENDLYGTANIGGRCGGSALNRDYSAGFSLLKSSQNFINIFSGSGRKKKERKLDSLSNVNLMVPIDEDDEENEDDYFVGD